jgi:hypothetical protein
MVQTRCFGMGKLKNGSNEMDGIKKKMQFHHFTFTISINHVFMQC